MQPSDIPSEDVPKSKTANKQEKAKTVKLAPVKDKHKIVKETERGRPKLQKPPAKPSPSKPAKGKDLAKGKVAPKKKSPGKDNKKSPSAPK